MKVKVSSPHQIAVPIQARRLLNIRGGDCLLLDVQDGVILFIPQPQDYAAHLAGLHKEVWQGLDSTAYLRKEREAWENSAMT